MFDLLRRVKAWLFTPATAPDPEPNASDTAKEIGHTAYETGQSLVPYDENLLEHSRTQWQFGDWVSLAALERDTLQHHPDRAKLALLAAAGRLQTGQDAEARKYIRHAQEWGISKKLISQILISGVHNSIGCAAAIGNQQHRALWHFENAISIGTPGVDAKLLTQARKGEQLSQLGLPTPDGYIKVGAGRTAKKKGLLHLCTEIVETPTKEKYANFVSQQYWEERYQNGGTSGFGSYGRLAEFKAQVINKFIKDEGIERVIEFGCGDGNQLSMFQVKKYAGVDVSQTAIDLCRNKFSGDEGKKFFTSLEFESCPHTADLTLSLDVIFHLIEDDVFSDYMKILFKSAERLCLIYACNENMAHKDSAHVKRRKFTDWIEVNAPEWALSSVIYNPYPFKKYKSSKISSFSNFYIFRKEVTLFDCGQNK